MRPPPGGAVFLVVPKLAAHYFKERWHAVPDYDYKKTNKKLPVYYKQ